MDRRILYVLGAAALLSSCAKVEMTDGGKALDPNQIAFSVRSGLQTQPGTRSGPEEDQPTMLLGGQGEDTLYLHPSVVVNDRGFSSPDTRGVPIEDPNDITSFFVTAKVNDAGNSAADALYFDETEVKRAGNVWTTTDGKHFWPDGQTTLDFYAYSNLIFAENDSPGVSSLTCEGGRLGFSYIVPNGTEGSDAERQPDILFALASANRSQTQDGDGTVILNFEHALAGVQFRAKNIAGGTIKSITLKNLYAQGDCTYTLSDETTDSGARKNGTFEWSNLGTKTDFTQKMSVKVSDSGTGTLPEDSVQDITTNGENSKMTFMMIPQSTADVEVEIVLEGDNNETYTVSGTLGNTGEWRPGYIYIYDISTDSINWTYVFDVSENITFELGQTSEPYTVKSYRYRTQLGDLEANREPVPWTAENISASETDPSNGTTSNVDITNIQTVFTSKGDGSVKGAQSYTLGLERGTLHTDYPKDVILQTAKDKGSADNPYDLSTSGGTLSQETANCYAINAPGTYKLPLVYGNAIKDGNPNTDAYSNSAFTDYLGNNITDPYIYKNHGYQPYDACLVWSDGFYMFENVHLDEQKQWLIFSVNRDYMQQANAILAVRDKEGKIMWSWHIWVTERDLVKEAHTLQDWTNLSTTYGLLPCNLGWVDGKMVYYNSRKLTYEFTQAESGYRRTMLVDQAGATFDYKDVGSTYYQWGRKDPIIALRNWNTYRFEDCRLHETSDPKYKYNISQEQVPIEATIQNPNIYYTATNSNGTWNTNWCTSVIPTLWDNSGNTTDVNKTTSVKTIYDPSPRGYKVPIPRAFSVFVKGNTKSGATGQNAINGYQIESGDYNQYRVKPNRDGTGNEIPLTATGQRADRNDLEAYSSAEGKKSEPGGLWAMYGVYYWTSGQVSSNANAGYSLCIRHDKGSNEYYYTYGFVGAKTMARPVRCIEDR